MRTLHVAALPFPSPQGTQALIHAMLTALHEAGDDVALLTYGHGAPGEPTPYRHIRAPLFVRDRSLRSGPSFAKLVHDVALAYALREQLHAWRPEVLVAHHVEAASLALALCDVPVVYVAHTSLRAELPSYGLPHVTAHVGAMGERVLCGKAARTLAVSPLLARMLAEESGAAVRAMTLPWSVPPALDERERERARVALDLVAHESVLLYAGNLDGYQGLDVVVDGLARLSREGVPFRLLCATASPTHVFAQRLAQAGLRDRARFVPLADEAARRSLHAAADFVLVPRASPGGIPIKLLDALARGVPVVAARRALAGLPLADACFVVRDDDPDDWARVLREALRTPHELRMAHAQHGRAHIADLHAPPRFVAFFHEALHGLVSRHGATR